MHASSAPSPSGTSSPAVTGSPATDAGGDDTDESANDADSGASTDASAAHVDLDLYCGPALDGAAAMGDMLDATDRKSSETGIENDAGDVAAMNAAADDILAAADAVETHWSEAADHVESASAPELPDFDPADVVAAFEDITTYLEAWVRPEAQLAASAGSIAEYDTGTVALLSDASATTAAALGGEGMSVVLTYTLERCGELPDL